MAASRLPFAIADLVDALLRERPPGPAGSRAMVVELRLDTDTFAAVRSALASHFGSYSVLAAPDKSLGDAIKINGIIICRLGWQAPAPRPSVPEEFDLGRALNGG